MLSAGNSGLLSPPWLKLTYEGLRLLGLPSTRGLAIRGQRVRKGGRYCFLGRTALWSHSQTLSWRRGRGYNSSVSACPKWPSSWVRKNGGSQRRLLLLLAASSPYNKRTAPSIALKWEWEGKGGFGLAFTLIYSCLKGEIKPRRAEYCILHGIWPWTSLPGTRGMGRWWSERQNGLRCHPQYRGVPEGPSEQKWCFLSSLLLNSLCHDSVYVGPHKPQVLINLCLQRTETDIQKSAWHQQSEPRVQSIPLQQYHVWQTYLVLVIYDR